MRAATNPTGFNAHSPERTERMCVMFREGMTLQQIGDAFSITRERVRQVITRAGVVRTDGGQHLQSNRRKARRQAATIARWDPRYMREFGCDYATLRKLNGGKRGYAKGTLAHRYHTQRHTAKHRGIEWQLSFPEWLVIWELSGHLHERGRGSGKYVMARKGDEGPYAVGNVYITTCNENARAYQSWRHGVDFTAHPELRRSRKYRGRRTPSNDPEAANG